MKSFFYVVLISVIIVSCKKKDDSSSAQTNSNVNLSSGLVASYPFTGNAFDISGHNYNGTVNGATLTNDRFGNPNSAYSFNGTNNYIDLSGYVSSFNFTQPASISFWVKSNYDGGQAIFSESASGAAPYSTNIDIGNNTTTSLSNELVLVTHQNSTTNFYIAGYTTSNRNLLFDNNWHHIVSVYDSVSTKIYLDNALLSLSCNYGTNNGQYGNVPNATIAVLGTRYASGYGAFFNGSLDDVRIYNRVLSSTEVSALFHVTN